MIMSMEHGLSAHVSNRAESIVLIYSSLVLASLSLPSLVSLSLLSLSISRASLVRRSLSLSLSCVSLPSISRVSFPPLSLAAWRRQWLSPPLQQIRREGRRQALMAGGCLAETAASEAGAPSPPPDPVGAEAAGSPRRARPWRQFSSPPLALSPSPLCPTDGSPPLCHGGARSPLVVGRRDGRPFFYLEP